MDFRCIAGMILILLLIGGLAPVPAQSYYNQPESMAFDESNNCWYVSNYGDGRIIRLDSGGQQSVFSNTLSRVAGLLLRDGILYAASNDSPFVGVMGFDIGTRMMTINIPVPVQGMVNDLIADNNGFLYVSDFYDNKIYKVHLESESVWLFAANNLPMPNGLEFDAVNNRLLVSCQNAAGRPIRAVDLADSTISTVIYTNLYGVDGLAFDEANRLYFSSWQTNAGYRCDAAFSEPPEMIASGFDGPADIAINHRDHVLGVPSFNRDTVDLVLLSNEAISQAVLPAKAVISGCYPNPFNVRAVFEFTLSAASDVRVEIFDSLGRLQVTLTSGTVEAGNHRAVWDAAAHAAGVYFSRISPGTAGEAHRIVLVK